MKSIIFYIVLFIFTYKSDAESTTATNTIVTRQAGILASAAKVIVEKAASTIADYLAKNMFQQSSFEVILSRTVIVSRNGNSVGIKDVSSGTSVSGTGKTPEEAMTNASKNYITFLLQLGFISIDDLHLAPHRTTTATPCGDLFPTYYCSNQKKLGNCYPNSAFYSFMKQNCFGTCSGCH